MCLYRLAFKLIPITLILLNCGSHSSTRLRDLASSDSVFKNEDSQEALIAKAIQEGDLEKVMGYFSGGLSLEINLKKNRTPLLEAFAWNRRAIAEYLIKLGASQEARDEDGNGLKELAGDNLNLLQVLDSDLRASIEKELFEAILADEFEWVEEVLEVKFANPNALQESETALTFAIKNGSRGAFNPLVKSRSSFHLNIDLNQKNGLGESPLALARIHNQKSLEKYLIEQGAKE